MISIKHNCSYASIKSSIRVSKEHMWKYLSKNKEILECFFPKYLKKDYPTEREIILSILNHLY